MVLALGGMGGRLTEVWTEDRGWKYRDRGENSNITMISKDDKAE